MRVEAFLTREREDLLGGFLRADAVGVPRLLPGPVVGFAELARGPALPALTVPLGPVAGLFLGVPGPKDECLASPLEVTGTVPPGPARGGRFVAGPAELSLWRLRIMLAAGVVGADAAC